MNKQKCIKSASRVWKDGLVFPVKVVLHKHVDLCWDPSTHIKGWAWSLTCQLPQHGAKLGSLPMANLAPGSMRDPASKEKSRMSQSKALHILHWPLGTCIHMYTNMHIHTYQDSMCLRWQSASLMCTELQVQSLTSQTKRDVVCLSSQCVGDGGRRIRGSRLFLTTQKVYVQPGLHEPLLASSLEK